MARGFESKSVEHQQDLAAGPLSERTTMGNPAVLVKRRKLEMALVEVRRSSGPPTPRRTARCCGARWLLWRRTSAPSVKVGSFHEAA